jgi:hypothetical protein
LVVCIAHYQCHIWHTIQQLKKSFGSSCSVCIWQSVSI